MNIINKYEMPFDRPLSLPHNANIKKIEYLNGTLCIWAMFAVGEICSEMRYFRMYATGEEIPNNLRYIDTVFDGEYVWHVFEELPP